MTTREPISSDDPRVRRYRVFNDAGQQIGTDEETIPTPEQVNAVTLRSRLLQALAANAAYLAQPASAAAQAAQVRRNTQQNTALIRLMLELLDTAEGT